MSILLNAIRCNHCGTVIVSEFTHDFRMCKCKKVSVDGGSEYLKRSFENYNDYMELSIFRENGVYMQVTK